MSYTEFKAVIKADGLPAAAWLAKQHGVSLAQTQLWVRRLP